MSDLNPLLCARCQLRAKNERTYLLYEKVTEEKPGFSCSLCLGVLHESSVEQISSSIEAHLSKIKHKKTLKINAAIPPSIYVLRERAFQICLKQQKADSVLVCLREALKWTLSSRLERLFDVSYTPDAQVFLDVAFTHPDSLADTSFVADAYPPAKAKRYCDTTASASSTSHIVRVVTAMSDDDFVNAAPANWFPPPPSEHTVSVCTELTTASVYLAGFYNKWSRIVSQTPWFTDEGDGGDGGEDGTNGNGGGRGRGDRRRRGGRGGGRWKGGKRARFDRRDENEDANGDRNSGALVEQATVDSEKAGQKLISENGHAEQPTLNAATAEPKLNTENGEPGQKKRTALSVEDAVLEGIRRVLQPEKASFCAGGREDVDVRMLGGGRPFFVEVTNPKIISDCITPELVKEMLPGADGHGAAVSVVGLRKVTKEFATKMKTVEADKRKHYRCVVWCSAPQTRADIERRLHITSEEEGTASHATGQKEGDTKPNANGNEHGMVLEQRTPLRVLHRRSQIVRKRTVYGLKVIDMVSPHFFVLELTAQAGTYIKEFVHGDCGRTVPSLSSILQCDADIIQLDVVRVDMGGLEKGLK